MNVHFILLDGEMPFQGCKTTIILTTENPDKVTCPQCQDNLRQLEKLLQMLNEEEENA